MNRRITTLLTASFLVGGALFPALVGDEDVSAFDAVSSAAPADVMSVANVLASQDGLNTQVNYVDLAVDVDPTIGITISAGGSEIGIGLPFADNADEGVSDSPGSLTFDNNKWHEQRLSFAQ